MRITTAFILRWLLSFLIWGMAVGAYAQFGFSLPKGKDQVEIPFKKYNNLVVLEVTLKNKATVNLILDTSIEHTLLTEKAIGDFLGFHYARKIKLGQNDQQVFYGHVAVDAQMALSDSVKTPEMSPMLVLETDYLNLAGMAGSKVHGLIGYDLFKSLVVEIDNAKNVIRLYTPKNFEAPKGYRKLSMEVIDRKPYLSVKAVFESWEERQMKFMLKTGASHAVFFEDDSVAFFLPYRNIELPIGQVYGGEVIGHIGRLRSLSIDQFTLENPLATFSKPEHVQTNEANKKIGDGSIGQGILQRFNVIYDFNQSHIYLKRNSNFSDLFEYDMSGLTIGVSNAPNYIFTIKSLRKDAPAEQAGLRQGDVIKSINGEDLTIDNYGSFLDVFLTRENKKVTFVVQRGEDLIECSFRLVRFI